MLNGFVPWLWGAAWPVLVGAGVLLMIRRLPPAGLFVRLGGVFAAVMIFAIAVSPRDPLTGQAVTSREVKTLVVSVGMLLGLLQIMFRDHLE